MPRLRVVMVIPSLGGTGGLERVASQLALELTTRVDRLVVCFARRGPYEDVLREAGVELVRIHRPRPRPDRMARAIGGLTRVLRAERPDVIHGHNPAAGFAAAGARTLARSNDSAIVTTFHGLAAHRLGSAARLLDRTSDAVISVGATSTRLLEEAGLPSGRATTIENAVSVAPERPRDEVRAELGGTGRELIVNVGRYVPEKNQELLLDAVALLARRRPHLRALLVGTGPLEGKLRARVSALGLDDVVELTGPRADAVDIIAASDVLAVSSQSEGLPLVVLEAMSLARPIVTTNVGSIPDAIESERTGIVVPSGDAQAFADALDRVLGDSGLAARLGAAARLEAAERFSIEAMTERTLEVYESAVAARRGRRA
jgi:glycosyltransferase involved in cell wall biosynthesis